MLKTNAGPKVTVGVDLGDRYADLCWLDSEGEVQEQSRVLSRPAALQQRFAGIAPCRVVLEVGPHSRWASQVIQECGHEVLIANARKVRLIAESNDKDDAADAEILARVGRVDPKLLSPIEHRSAQAQADLTVLRARDTLVRSRTQLINHIRGTVKALGARLPGMSADSFGRKAWTHLPSELRGVLGPLIELIAELTRQIHKYEADIDALCDQKYPQTQRLRQVAGVGPITSLAFVLTLDDPARFRKSRAVGPYLGLCRRRRKSGDSDPQLGISKSGSPFLRKLLLQSSHYILGPHGPDCDLRRRGLGIAGGGRAAKKRAAVAVARKLAVLLHRLWVSDHPYRPLKQA